MLQEADHIKNTLVLIYRHIQCLHLMNYEVACVLLSTGTRIQPQIILDPDYLPDHFSVSYDYDIVRGLCVYEAITRIDTLKYLTNE